VHGYSNDDGCIDEGDEYVADLELFIPAIRVTIKQETENFILLEYEGHLIEVVIRCIRLSTVEFDAEVSIVDERNVRFWLLIRIDCDLCVFEIKVWDIFIVDE